MLLCFYGVVSYQRELLEEFSVSLVVYLCSRSIEWTAMLNRITCYKIQLKKLTVTVVGCVAQLAERRSLAGELTLSYAPPAADG